MRHHDAPTFAPHRIISGALPGDQWRTTSHLRQTSADATFLPETPSSLV
jgi:hypothetical protein